jgi:hypothetical protein
LFRTEKDIFDFLGIQFKEPTERKDGRSVIPELATPELTKPVSPEFIEIVPVKKQKRKTLKNKDLKVEPEKEPEKEEEPENIDTEAINIIIDFKQNGISVLEKFGFSFAQLL